MRTLPFMFFFPAGNPQNKRPKFRSSPDEISQLTSEVEDVMIAGIDPKIAKAMFQLCAEIKRDIILGEVLYTQAQ
jgi:hypothetical protein